MAVDPKSPEAEALLKRLSAETGESLTEAATTAFRERLERIEAEKSSEQDRDPTYLLDLVREAKAAPVVDPRPIKVIRDELWGDA